GPAATRRYAAPCRGRFPPPTGVVATGGPIQASAHTRPRQHRCAPTRRHGWSPGPRRWQCRYACAGRSRSASSAAGSLLTCLNSENPRPTIRLREPAGLAGHASVESGRERSPGRSTHQRAASPTGAAGNTRASLPGLLRHATGGPPERDTAKVHTSRKILAQQPVGVLIGATLPGAASPAEVDPG